MIKHKGSCHCQAVKFTVLAPSDIEVHQCNCSMCNRLAYLHMIVPKSHFELVSGEQDLTCYKFNTGLATHYFCSHCGIKSFYVPRSNPDGVSVNLRCVEQDHFNHINIKLFDGVSWEESADSLAHLSKEK